MNNDARRRARVARSARAASDRPPTRRATWLIADRARLGTEIRQVIGGRYGSVNAAARSIGLSQPTLHRLAAGQVGRMTEATMQGLERLFVRRSASWKRAVLPSEALIPGAAYSYWLHDWLSRTGREKGSWRDVPVTRRLREWPGLLAQKSKLLLRIRKVAPSTVKTLRGMARDPRFRRDRIVLALERIIEPLLDARGSGGIERYPDELDDAELRAFVEAGMKRERILLMRESDADRARETETAPTAREAEDLLSLELDRQLYERILTRTLRLPPQDAPSPASPATTSRDILHLLTR